eukprot:TRINITY_DN10873_c0_g1_i4.p1 TRINITY_DN10873_c0_g1~~TRINITY_DN10873_c0_g1_i4.p1  ORF type:complete len:246 (+),score=55.46 TRINITY_DN10873_c0_g1_i4:56-793(+)
MVLRRLPRSVAVYANNSNMLFHAQGELEILRETALEAPPLVLEPPSPAEEHSAQVEGLPSDVLSQVLKRLFGFQLPVTVCKGWAVACQDKALWRSYCHAAWGAQCDPGRWGNDWQLMYRQRARALRHGVYCVHVSYTRGGDNPESVEQSWHAVDYYRYFCFLGQGSCLVSRSFLRPALVAEQLAPVFSSTAPADQVAREGSTQGLALYSCLLYTSDAADEEDSVDLGGRRIIKKKKNRELTVLSI